jgi:hypothetical protein
VIFIYALTDIDKFHSENDGSRAADLQKRRRFSRATAFQTRATDTSFRADALKSDG